MSYNKIMNEKRVTILDIQKKKEMGEPISMVTAYDFPTAQLVDAAGIDMILVGDSLGMVVLGYDSTVPVTMEEMLHHCRAAARGTKRAFLVGDMPFMSYQADVAEAVRNAGRLMKEGGADCVKLEGGRERSKTIAAIVDAGIPVQGHIGLTPQSTAKLGGYRVQGKTAAAVSKLVDDALTLQDAGCFSIVLEAMPEAAANRVTERLDIPTIGIGAGGGCDGQVLVFHDMLGIHDMRLPRFVKQYSNLRETIIEALEIYNQEVKSRAFPAEEHTYPMKPEEEALLLDDEKQH
jgi:3-methyl-2-oxobutanoate hydroxymethyltransferase